MVGFDTIGCKVLANSGLWYLANPECRKIYNRGLDNRSALPVFSSEHRAWMFLFVNDPGDTLEPEFVRPGEIHNFLDSLVKSEFIDVDSVSLEELNRIDREQFCRLLRAELN